MHLIKSVTPGLGRGGRKLRAESPQGDMRRGPRWLLIEPCISVACLDFPQAAAEVGVGRQV